MNQHLPPASYPRFHLAFRVTDLAKARHFGVVTDIATWQRRADAK